MSDQSPVLSRPVVVEGLPPEGLGLLVETTESERAALSRIDGLASLHSLVGTFLIKSEPLGAVRVTGDVRATVTQTCVVTLEPFDSELVEPVDVTFLPEKGMADWLKARQGTTEDDYDDVDPPDPIVGGRIDLGALTAEMLALGLDPYPRKPGVEFDGGAPPERDPSPFAALAALKPKG